MYQAKLACEYKYKVVWGNEGILQPAHNDMDLQELMKYLTYISYQYEELVSPHLSLWFYLGYNPLTLMMIISATSCIDHVGNGMLTVEADDVYLIVSLCTDIYTVNQAWL